MTYPKADKKNNNETKKKKKPTSYNRYPNRPQPYFCSCHNNSIYTVHQIPIVMSSPAERRHCFSFKLVNKQLNNILVDTRRYGGKRIRRL